MPFNETVTDRIPKSSDIPVVDNCPFCDSDSIHANQNKNMVYIECLDCHCRTGDSFTLTIAVVRWNKRLKKGDLNGDN